MLQTLLYAYILGGITFIPLLVAFFLFITIYTSVPVGDADVTKRRRQKLEASSAELSSDASGVVSECGDTEMTSAEATIETNDAPRPRKGWLTMRRTYEESVTDGGYVTLVRSFLDARSKDPKRSRPKDMWYVALKGKVLFLYEDEGMSECEAAVELSSHDVVIYPEGLLDGELYAKRNAICLKPKPVSYDDHPPSVARDMMLSQDNPQSQEADGGPKKDAVAEERTEEERNIAHELASDPTTPWFIFVRANVDMEDWYFALLHASEYPSQTPMLAPLRKIFEPADMNHLVASIDEQPDVIPMRWLNALLGRLFLSHYRTHNLEAFIIGRLMKKLSKVKRPAFLTDIVVTEVSVGNKAPMLSKPMLKELTKEGDASLEVHFQYKGEIRITVEATATINLSARFKSYTVKLVLAAVLKELEGNLLVKMKRPPSNRIWYAFTQTPRIVMAVEPIVSDRQITWAMILSSIESKFKEIIQESVVMPNMDDIAFFETSHYLHRGGIFSDASRNPGTPRHDSDANKEESPRTPSSAQDPSTSTPVELLERAETADPIMMTDHSHVADENASQKPTSKANETDIIGPVPISSRRRSWFSNESSLESDISSSNLGKRENGSEMNPTRGRGLGAENKASSRIALTNDATVEDSVEETLAATESLAPQQIRRSASSNSSKREQASPGAVGSPFLEVKSAPSTPRRSSDAAPSTSSVLSASPPGFFSVLKSRAADKQALSNTAKEAMRKWGVNWGGLKKDVVASGVGSGDDAFDGGTGSSSQPRGSSSGVALAKRMNYAEVRAAVTERKEREKVTGSIDDGSRTSSDGPMTKTRVVSNPLALLNGAISSQDGLALPINRNVSTSTKAISSKKSIPSISKVTTDAGTSDIEPLEEHVSSLIYVQPQAKTMSIPGIHASHRGDVMSMGYVAPAPSHSSQPLDSKSNTSGMQTVYRLWKNPLNLEGDQEVHTALETQVRGLDEENGEPAKEATIPAVSNAALEGQAMVARPIPPPLPPRAQCREDEGAVTAKASEILKYIATKDANIRMQHSPPDSHPLSKNDGPKASDGDDDEAHAQAAESGILATSSPRNVAQLDRPIPPPLPPRHTQVFFA